MVFVEMVVVIFLVFEVVMVNFLAVMVDVVVEMVVVVMAEVASPSLSQDLSFTFLHNCPHNHP